MGPESINHEGQEVERRTLKRSFFVSFMVQLTRVDYPRDVGENDLALSRDPDLSGFQVVGLWRSWERASMAWKRSSVRSRPGPPYSQVLAETPLFLPNRCRSLPQLLLLMESTVACACPLVPRPLGKGNEHLLLL